MPAESFCTVLHPYYTILFVSRVYFVCFGLNAKTALSFRGSSETVLWFPVLFSGSFVVLGGM